MTHRNGAAGTAVLPSRRMAAQRISRPEGGTPADVVAWLGAVQAQDYAGCKWAVGLRLGRTFTDAHVERALDDGSILRVHAMRWTWQLIAPADVRWMLALLGPGRIAGAERRRHWHGLDTATIRRSQAAIEKALRGGQQLTRAELGAAIAAAGVAIEGRLSYLLGHAELEGAICSGARLGKLATFALLDDRVPERGPPLAREDALAALARRYFRSRGPATRRDFGWWSGLSAADAQAAVESVRPELAVEQIDGRTYYSADDAAAPAASRAVHLLPPFDEYLVAYVHRDAVLDPAHTKRINAGGGLLAPSIVVNGRVIGTWRRLLERDAVAIELQPFGRLSPGALRGVRAAARRYAAFLALPARITVAHHPQAPSSAPKRPRRSTARS